MATAVESGSVNSKPKSRNDFRAVCRAEEQLFVAQLKANNMRLWKQYVRGPGGLLGEKGRPFGVAFVATGAHGIDFGASAVCPRDRWDRYFAMHYAIKNSTSLTSQEVAELAKLPAKLRQAQLAGICFDFPKRTRKAVVRMLDATLNQLLAQTQTAETH
jgi:hypothetical protein